MLEQGLREEQLVSFGILAAIVLVAALNICAGFEMLRRDQARR
jgi:hypothetical protein